MADKERIITREEYVEKASQQIGIQLHEFSSVAPELFAMVAGQLFDKLTMLSEEDYFKWLNQQEGKYKWLTFTVAQTRLLVSAALGRLAQGYEIERSVKNLPASGWTGRKKK